MLKAQTTNWGRPRWVAPTLALLLLTALFITLPVNAQSEDPSDPVLLTGHAPGLAAGGNHARTDDGRIHFVWNECTVESQCLNGGSGEKLILRHRSLDPDTKEWSETSTVREHSGHLVNPRIYAAGSTLHLTWLQDWNPSEDEPIRLWHCTLDDSLSCTDAQRISPTSDQAIYQAGAVAPDGKLHIVWQEESTGSRSSRLLYRAQQSGGWGPLVEFPTESEWQRNAAITIDTQNVAHVSWTDKPAGTPISQVDEQILHATVPPGADGPDSLRQLSEGIVIKHRSGLLAVEDTIHAVFSNETDTFHRILEPGDEEWSDPVNLSRDPYMGGGNFPMLVATEDDTLTAAWINRTQEGFMLWTTQYIEGLWHRPRLSAGPMHALHLPTAIDDPQGFAHFAWSGALTEDEYNQMFYFSPLSDSKETRDPEIDQVQPRQEAWVNDAEVIVGAHVLLDAPLDRAESELLVNGVRYDVEGAGTMVRGVVDNLTEGTHHAELTVRDAQGRETERSWSFHVDRQSPTFEVWTEEASVTTNITGWHTEPVTIYGNADARGGAPARVQLAALAYGVEWQDLDPDGLELLEGWLYELDFRAIDDAGNTAESIEFPGVGWDATPPEAEVQAPPRWSQHRELAITITSVLDGDDDEGSPERISFTLHPADDADAAPVHEHGASPTDGRTTLTGVPEGDYMMHVNISDEAGNVQDSLPGPWPVGIDITYPELRITPLELDEGVRIEASDSLSGVARLVLQDAEGVALEEWTYNGTSGIEMDLLEADLQDVQSVWLEDAAGNAVQARSGLEGWEVEQIRRPDPPSQSDEGPTDETGSGGGNIDEIDETPGPGVLLLLIATMIAVLWSRRGPASHPTRKRNDPRETQ